MLVHLWVGYSETTRDYASDLHELLSELPHLKLVLAHFGLGFDPATLPAIVSLMERHRNLYLDTSLYGSFCELWFSRASNQAAALAAAVRRFPNQVLFGSDVFGSRRKRGHEYADALRASIAVITELTHDCAEFKRTAYFDNAEDKYGKVEFTPLSLSGLGLGADSGLMDRILRRNAMEVLGIAEL